MVLSPNLVTSKVSVAERWLKLYRKIFNFFLKRDFVHKADYIRELAEINANLTLIQAKISAMDGFLLAHTHPGTPPPAPGVVTGPAAAGVPPYVPTPLLTIKPVTHKDIFAEQQDAAQLGTGPARAPIGDGVSPEAIKATTTAATDVGF